MIAILAHQGGWDEMLMVAAPILVIVGLLRLARRRAEHSALDPAPEAQVTPTTEH